MATLEVHDGRGRVEYVVISQDHTALFGSDPKCDVVVNDPQVLPFHGRLRWKAGKIKAEAFPEANALDLNGKKVVSASFNVGDELKVGAYRIFLQSVDENGAAGADKTREQKAPAAKRAAAGAKAPASAAKGSTATLPGAPQKSRRRPLRSSPAGRSARCLTSSCPRIRGRAMRASPARRWSWG